MKLDDYEQWVRRELDDAIDKQEIEMHYQPKVSTVTGKVTGLEALARWKRGSMDFLPVGVFIGVAESSSLVGKFGEYVISTVLKQMQTWDELGLGYGQVSINVSSNQLTEDYYMVRFRRLVSQIEEYNIDASRITLEITERKQVEFTEANLEELRMLRATGVRISIDDFGSGYSSLAYLAELPVDEVKLDRSLISKLTTSPRMKILLTHIFDIARSLNLDVVVEGVETKEQVDLLKTMFTGELQGHYFFQVLCPEELTDILAVTA